ncbi:MAG TPA: hypothetical protein VFT54_08865 [Acidimicrobiia bacterium]|nr:hypothetical protein [Acidimicrobiia bacterium]
MRFRHVALMISDLRAAEYYYRAIFGMSVLFREAAMEPGGPQAEAWATLPPGSGWEEAEAAGVSIGMAALQRDDVVLTLLAAESTGEQIYTIGFTISNEEMEGLRSRGFRSNRSSKVRPRVGWPSSIVSECGGRSRISFWPAPKATRIAMGQASIELRILPVSARLILSIPALGPRVMHGGCLAVWLSPSGSSSHQLRPGTKFLG